jgi:hypothetical protein
LPTFIITIYSMECNFTLHSSRTPCNILLCNILLRNILLRNILLRNILLRNILLRNILLRNILTYKYNSFIKKYHFHVHLKIEANHCIKSLRQDKMKHALEEAVPIPTCLTVQASHVVDVALQTLKLKRSTSPPIPK